MDMHHRAKEGQKRDMKAFALDQMPEVEVSGLKASSVTRTAGGKLKVVWDDANFKVADKDEYTQYVLPQKLIKEQSLKN